MFEMLNKLTVQMCFSNCIDGLHEIDVGLLLILLILKVLFFSLNFESFN